MFWGKNAFLQGKKDFNLKVKYMHLLHSLIKIILDELNTMKKKQFHSQNHLDITRLERLEIVYQVSAVMLQINNMI